MTPEQATDLAVHCNRTWPHGPAAHIWETELLDLNHDQTTEALRRMRRNPNTRGELAEFVAHYRAITRASAATLTIICCDICGKPLDDPTRWRHPDCHPDPNILAKIREVRAQLRKEPTR